MLWFDVMKPMMSKSAGRAAAHLRAFRTYADATEVAVLNEAQTAVDRLLNAPPSPTGCTGSESPRYSRPPWPTRRTPARIAAGVRSEWVWAGARFAGGDIWWHLRYCSHMTTDSGSSDRADRAIPTGREE